MAEGIGGCAAGTVGDGAGGDGESLIGALTLRVSASPTRSPSVLLNGATLASAPAYVFTSDGSASPRPTGIAHVRFWLDDPAMVGAPRHTENFVPYDFAGTAPDGSAYAWDAGKIAAGQHTITESVTTTSDGITTFTATFTVGTPIKHSVALAWVPSATPGVTYGVYRGTTAGGPYTAIQSGLSSATTTDPSVSDATKYYYVVRAHNAAGESGNSNEIAAVVP
jgi:hypothetical protein